jgi:hypothetical protein
MRFPWIKEETRENECNPLLWETWFWKNKKKPWQ